MSEFNMQNFANTAWAFAVVNFYSELPFGPEGGTAVEGAGSCCRVVHKGFQVAGSCEHSVNVSVGYEEERHFTALAAATKWRVRDFKAQDLTNTAWEFATIGQKDERLFTVLARKDVNP